jgi:hypothetical protein
VPYRLRVLRLIETNGCASAGSWLLGVSLRRGRAGSYRGLVHSTWARRNRHRQQYRSFLKGDLDTFAAQAFLNFSGVEWRNGRALSSRVRRAERLRLSREATAKAKAERDARPMLLRVLRSSCWRREGSCVYPILAQ